LPRISAAGLDRHLIAEQNVTREINRAHTALTQHRFI
jgi:hypothetical protein